MSEAIAAGRPLAAAGDRPSAVDNSATTYFPPIGDQDHGDCTCWSSVYYYNTYTQARDEGLDASTGNLDALCSHRFMFSLINQGARGAEGTRYVITHVSDVGAANASYHSLTEDILTWPTEAAWVQALRNRTGTPHSIRADNEDGLETTKQHLANGNCIVTRGVLSVNFSQYPDNSVTGIDNRVWYWKDDLWYRHSVCVVGYNDTRSYVDHRDGETHYGAFLVANSEGPNWGWSNTAGKKGYFWIAYTMFLEGKFGWYDDPWPYTDPCYDNAPYPEMYYNDDRPHYRPRLYAVAGINHAKRNKLAVTGGIGDTVAPGFLGPETIRQTTYGDILMDDSRRVAVDLTDGAGLIQPGVPKQVFVRLTLSSSAGSNATITSADFHYDPLGDGDSMIFSSPDPTVTITPGHTGHATVQIAGPVTLYVDADNVDDAAQDGSPAHPFATIQAAIDAAAGPALVKVMPGAYTGQIVMADNVWLLGSGSSRTFLAPPGDVPTVLFNNVKGGLIAGFTVTALPGASGVAIRSWSSTTTVRDCICTGGRNGIGADIAGSIKIVNCLLADNGNVGIYLGGTVQAAIANCTVANNATYGVRVNGGNAVRIENSILWSNGDDISVGTEATVMARYCDIGDGDFAGMNGCFAADPRFVSGPHHDYYLSQTAAGQPLDSPCVDAGSLSAFFHDLEIRTTRTDEARDLGTVDVGYHAAHVLRIMSIARTSPDVQLQWNARPGASYVVAWSDDRSAWHDVPVGETGAWLDTDAASCALKYYRVREQ
ncbi:MAG: right-handed parallel beta-helix repeat-containing protein [Verrucomicrobia bacterium]|nr:right-handed parallel beta-helix repeat-containing protein [Verrucomicrobiota bacterium]